MKEETCKTCTNFNFKVRGANGIGWGTCLSKDVHESQYISLSLVQEIFEHPRPDELREAIKNYAMIEYREDAFGCRFHSPEKEWF
jgi:hypothetical protein